MQISKGSINLKEQIAKTATSALVEGDIIISDGSPDAAEILCADAKSRVDGTEYKNGRLIVFGTVEFTALYMPDDECAELKKLSHSFEFTSSIEMCGGENAEFQAEAQTEHIGFTLVNSRKLSAKIMVSVKACAYQEKNYEPIKDIEADNIELTNKQYNIYVPISETKTEFELNDLLTIPEDKSDIGEILKTDAWVTQGDIRVMNDKAMVQGELHINTLYTAADENGKVCSVAHSVPFTEIVEASGADEYSVVNVCYNVLEIGTSIKGDLNGDTKIISVESVICANVKVSKTISETVVDDCYFLDGETEQKTDKMQIFEYITSENVRITKCNEIKFPQNVTPKEIISCNTRPVMTGAEWNQGTASINGVLVTYLIYRDNDDKIRCAVSESDLNWEKAIPEECVIEAHFTLEDTAVKVQGTNCEVMTNMGLFMKALKPRYTEILVDCTRKEREPSKTQPSMVVYFAKAGDTVWSVAKKYCTKSEKIKKANNLDTEVIEKGKRLLIPMV